MEDDRGGEGGGWGGGGWNKGTLDRQFLSIAETISPIYRPFEKGLTWRRNRGGFHLPGILNCHSA